MTPADVVRAYFEQPDGTWFTGDLATWAELHARIAAPRRYASEFNLSQLEVLEETPARAVVMVRAEAVSRMHRGAYSWRTSFDGPVVLDLTEDGWRISDYTVDGRRRSENLVIGPLAEQENGGVTVRALGVDRLPRGTEVLLEVGNGGAEELRIVHGLVLHAGVWRRPTPRAAPIAPGESAVVAMTVGPIALTQQAMTVGFRARSGRRKLNFLFHVPLARPAEPFRSAPPRRLPLLQDSTATILAVSALVALGMALLLGWFALVVPIFVGLVYWRHLRLLGRLPARLHPVRHVLDVGLVATCCVVPWFTPAAELSVPVAVAVAAYLIGRVVRISEGARVVLAVSATTGWFGVLGGPDDPLSPCRVAGGNPARTADAFAGAVLRADLPTAHALETAEAQRYGRFLPHPVRPAAATAALGRRRDLTSTRLCRSLGRDGVTHCYVYALERRRLPLYVGVRCAAHDWRVAVAF